MTATFVVESGAGLVDSNSFGSIEEALQYAEDYNFTGWIAEGDDAILQLHLRLATQFIVATWDGSFIGYKKTLAQALPWPRVRAVTVDDLTLSNTSLPTQLKHATFELGEASRAGKVLIAPSLENKGSLIKKKTKAGDIESEKEWERGSYTEGAVDFPRAESLISTLLLDGSRIYIA